MDSTDGLQRGADEVVTGNPIQMPIGEAVNGRLFNVIGDAIDGIGNLPKTEKDGLPIHRKHQSLTNCPLRQKFFLLGSKSLT